mmetsp:Transcript_36709/g.86139  ORF Transcript_36709/g.86139 Transcript_36709/m.86139 type:complete len:248 (+) Transcript_36709:384-1127(+)
MARGCGDGEVSIIPRLAVTPPLDLEAEDAELEQHGAHLRGHVPEVLAAYHHVGRGLDRAQVAEPLLPQAPVGVVAPPVAVLGDLPHAEEAEHVVDAVGVKVLLHVREPAPPPRAPVLVHRVPVVGREAPVLLGVAGGAAVLVQLEQVRLGPHVGGTPRDPDGEVALQGNSIGCRVLRCLEELEVEVVLREVHPDDFVVVLAVVRHYRLCLRHPLGPARRVEPLVVEGLLLDKLHLEGGVHLDPALRR